MKWSDRQTKIEGGQRLIPIMSDQAHWYQFKGLGFIFIAVAVIWYFVKYICQVFHHGLPGYLSSWWDWANSSYIPLTYQQEGTWSIAGIPFFIGHRHENLSSALFQKILSNKDRELASPSYPQEPISTLCYLTNIISMLLLSEQTDIRPPLSSATA